MFLSLFDSFHKVAALENHKKCTTNTCKNRLHLAKGCTRTKTDTDLPRNLYAYLFK